jgi:hypothetical protein
MAKLHSAFEPIVAKHLGNCLNEGRLWAVCPRIRPSLGSKVNANFCYQFGDLDGEAAS